MVNKYSKALQICGNLNKEDMSIYDKVSCTKKKKVNEFESCHFDLFETK